MTFIVAQSLIADYGVEPARCFVTRAPQPLIDPQSHTPTGDILFVGNDFERKGGFDLLTVFERKLLPEFRLAIASNDPVVRGLALPGGVRLISGVTDPTQLAQLYRQSDLLVLPTHSDCYSLVVCEAAAQGVPALATRVGGIGELFDESGGLSLPRDGSPGRARAPHPRGAGVRVPGALPRRPADLPGKSSSCRSSTKPYGGRWVRWHRRNSVTVGRYSQSPSHLILWCDI